MKKKDKLLPVRVRSPSCAQCFSSVMIFIIQFYGLPVFLYLPD